MARKKAVRKGAKKIAKAQSMVRRPKRAATSSSKPVARKVRQGLITHTEFASTDPPATRAWCAKILGWKFGEPMPTPTGPYHMSMFENATAVGIRANNPPEAPGSIPYCEVADIKATFAKAIANGAMEMLAPMQLPGGAGWIAIVAAPGGVAIGFWGIK